MTSGENYLEQNAEQGPGTAARTPLLEARGDERLVSSTPCGRIRAPDGFVKPVVASRPFATKCDVRVGTRQINSVPVLPRRMMGSSFQKFLMRCSNFRRSQPSEQVQDIRSNLKDENLTQIPKCPTLLLGPDASARLICIPGLASKAARARGCFPGLASEAARARG